MSIKNLKWLSLLSSILLMLSGCNSGGGSGSTPTPVPGTLSIINATSSSNVVLGGTYQYVVSLANSSNLAEPIIINVTSTNSSVASIESNSCTTFESNQMCNFFVRGVNTGNATIIVSSNNYQPIIESLNVNQQWGTYAGGWKYGNLAGGVSQLSFGGNYVYARDDLGRAVRSTGDIWEDIGGGSFITDAYNNPQSMSSDESRVCIGLNNYSISPTSSEIKCSFNNSAWQTLPTIQQMEIIVTNIYQDNLYVLGTTNLPIKYVLLSCPIDNCTTWQIRGESLPSTQYYGILYNATPYVLKDDGIYYQDENTGLWQLYGSYPSTFLTTNNLAAGPLGVAVMPFLGVQTESYVQPVYYNGAIGGIFESVSGGIENNSIYYDGDSLAMNNNILLASLGDGNIYYVTNNTGMWSSWSRLGENNPALYRVFTHNDKVYSIDHSDGESSETYVYVYSLN